MPNLLNTLKLTGCAGLAAFALAASAAPASAHYCYDQCDRHGERCWRVECNDRGYDCRRTGYWTNARLRPPAPPPRAWVCNPYGRGCGWVVLDARGGYWRNGLYIQVRLP